MGATHATHFAKKLDQESTVQQEKPLCRAVGASKAAEYGSRNDSMIAEFLKALCSDAKRAGVPASTSGAESRTGDHDTPLDATTRAAAPWEASRTNRKR